MALVDQLMGKPMEAVAPLTGAPETYQKAVQTSYDIAQNQEKLRIADEQLKLQQEQNKMEYLSKGLTAFNALAKAKGPVRKTIGDVVVQYFTAAGMPPKPETTKWIFSDEETLKSAYEIIKNAEAQGKSPLQQIALIQDGFSADPEQAKPYFESVIANQRLEGQLRNQLAVESTKEMFKSGVEVQKMQMEWEKENRQAVQKVLENADIPPAFILKHQRNPMFPQLLQGYANQIGTEARQLRTRVSGLEGVSPKGVSAIEETLKAAEQAYLAGEVERAAELKNRALVEERLLQANKEDPQKADKLLGAIKQAGDIFDKSIGQESKDRIGYLNQIISMANDPNARKNPFSGQLALNGFAKVADPRTGVRDAEYNRIAKASGTTLESFKQIWGKMVRGEPLTPVQWANLNRVAKMVQDVERKEYNRKFENFSKISKKAGLSQADINIFSLEFQRPVYGISGEEENQAAKPSQVPWSLNKYKQKYPNLTEDQYKAATQMAKDAGRKVVD